MIGVVVPVHDEEAHLDACLTALDRASHHRALRGEPVIILAVLDRCVDGSARIARRHGVASLEVDVRSVGAARAIGAQYVLQHGARWLANTDADTLVAPDWLASQLALDADAVCGTVGVHDWPLDSTALRGAFESRYQDADGHRHIHGANLGICARAYVRAGGFAPVHADEDVALVHSLEDIGASVAWSAQPRVRTSARLIGRAPRGFAHYLADLQERSPANRHVDMPATTPRYRCGADSVCLRRDVIMARLATSRV
ncbi:MAG TPA: glycosyltransferase family A protein [Casimicrobiaceae bacterium]|jgi:glycosyltransferase involved in cell wall biosynthesis